MGKYTGFNVFLRHALKYGFSLFGSPKTGQITKYRTGDDGDLEKGYPKKPPRFTDNGDGTITDNATGVIWVKEPGAIGGNFGSAGSPSPMTWNNAVDECVGLTYAGHSDWRLPNAIELASILDLGAYSPSLNATYFPSSKYEHSGPPLFKDVYYWTATTQTRNTGKVICIRFYEGETDFIAKTESVHYPRPVRGGV